MRLTNYDGVGDVFYLVKYLFPLKIKCSYSIIRISIIRKLSYRKFENAYVIRISRSKFLSRRSKTITAVSKTLFIKKKKLIL